MKQTVEQWSFPRSEQKVNWSFRFPFWRERGRERERESFNQQAGSIAKVNQEALISERSWFLESRHKIKGIIIKEKWMNEQTESKATFKLNEISI